MYKKKGSSEVVITELMLPSNTNFGGKIHGGYLLSLMDQIAFACASKHSENYCVTASVNTVDFLNPVEEGELVTLSASINYVGRTSMVVGIKVVSENIRTKTMKHCNSSYFVMVAKGDDGTPAEVPGLVLENDQDVRRYMEAFERLKLNKQTKQLFNEHKFDADVYKTSLKDNPNVELRL